MSLQRATPKHEAGQALVIMVVSLIAVIGMTGLIIDGGNAWANQRMVQNGADAAAEAGAVVMAQRVAGATAPAVGWDQAVEDAINASATANNVTITHAYYTDICGIPLQADGSAALTGDGSYDFSRAQPVGSGLPASTSTTPDCPSHNVGPTAGVIVLAHRDLRTYFANVVGLATIPVDTQATAAAGYLQESCDATEGEACAVLPVVFPVNITSCDGSNNPIDTGVPWTADATTVYKIPLCQNGPGNVGWLDWTPTAGGTSELINSIQVSDNPAISLASWQYVTATGNVNSGGVQSALRAYDGQVVLVPQFDYTCNPGPGNTPNQALVDDATQHFGCTSAAVNNLGGNGSNQWYRIPSFTHFRLCISTDAACTAVGASHGAYVNGSNSVCDTGNGATSCLVGKFESITSTGTIGPGVGGGTGNSKAVGIQLIK